MKKISILLCVLSFFSIDLKAQDIKLYENAYIILNGMLEDSTKYSFKKAVFTVENAYLYGSLDTIFLNREIKRLTSLSRGIIEARELPNYNYRDKEKVLKYSALFSVMRDSIPVIIDQKNYTYNPFSYDFDDIWGNEDWSNMFVSKLINSRNGNCHSLPYLYKILAEEMSVDSHLALAPNHIYIKHRNEKDGWYNTELTSGYFPIDAWIMASGYVHLDAIRNGVYMKALNDKESIALMLVDLAQGYDKQEPYNDGTFILKCLETALKYHPNNINALLLKLETYKKKLDYMADKRGKEVNEIMDDPKAQELFQYLTIQVQHIHELGYRQMPKEMYLDWLVSLKEEKAKYQNKKITTFKSNK